MKLVSPFSKTILICGVLLILDGFITLPFWAAILGVFSGMPWHTTYKITFCLA